ncbi:hypothetical protein UMZ34_21275 [Halopseudomonas pachastrellae]|nr:hypothetical protein UMZ34_21275 [Halopseudomonas pachastrellae]
MTMGFKAKPDQLPNAERRGPGRIRVLSEGMDSTITRIEKQ